MRKRGASLLLELHGWRGLGRDRDLFWLHLRLGFLTLALSRVLVDEKLREIARNLAKLSGKLR